MTGSLNCSRASLLIRTLWENGVRHFCLAPGSRSTPLMLAIASLPEEASSVHFDERGLGFYGLGIAKGSKTPVALIVTSGTAVANLFPALVEAFLSRTPLILLTADRPQELQDLGANQTIDQIKIFSSYVIWETNLPLSDPLYLDSHIASSAAYAAYKSLEGPIHINCMIREPLFSLENAPPLSTASCFYEHSELTPSSTTLNKWRELLSKQKKGIILLGSEALEGSHEDLLLLAKKLNWPIFSDILSGGRKIGNHPYHIEHLDLILKTDPDIEIEAVLHIGNQIVSKTTNTWLKKERSIPYFLVTAHPSRQDPNLLVSHRLACKTSLFCEALAKTIPESKDSSWLLSWRRKADTIKGKLSSFFSTNSTFSEPSILYSIPSSFPLFISNSMPIRDADLFLFPEKGIPSVFANRGASGIDGNIATAAGIAQGLQKPLIAILGDLASLHDINSLALIQKSKTPIILIIINNQGGGIFSFLPIAEKKEVFEKWVATNHNYQFESFAKAFSLPFTSVNSLASWKNALEKALLDGKSALIECKTNRQTNVLNHESIYEHLASYKKIKTT
jgi:2-succinyl-5-enolpyruvyl-6-hydroxy-3-cyclohexene-1-carboxylate synthase